MAQEGPDGVDDEDDVLAVARAVLTTCKIDSNLEVFGFFMYSTPVQVLQMPKGTTYTQARAHLAKICDEVAETREPYIIERRSAENVAMISEDDAGDQLPSLEEVNGVQIFVPADDAKRAAQLLAERE